MERDETRRAAISKVSSLWLLASTLIVLNCGLAAVAMGRYPAFFQQHRAFYYPLVFTATELAYLVAFRYVAQSTGALICAGRGIAVVVGVGTGILEIVNVVFENYFAAIVQSPAWSIGFMLAVFSVWGVASALTARARKSFAAGVIAAVVSAGLCMLIAVTAGFCVELFLRPPDPTVVTTWAEFKRSGWGDPHAFLLANTLESAYTHLLIAPVVAVLFGSAGAAVSRLMPSGTSH
jgi:hypothetical protein